MRLQLIPVVDEGLGNSTDLLDVGAGLALVVDPERDVRQVRAEARRLGLRIVFAAETHLHADFISGVCELAETEGARVLAPEVDPCGFAYSGLKDGDQLPVGRIPCSRSRHRAIHRSTSLTCCSTPASLPASSRRLPDGGNCGRTDLVSPEMTVPLARAPHHSLQLLMELPDETPV